MKIKIILTMILMAQQLMSQTQSFNFVNSATEQVDTFFTTTEAQEEASRPRFTYTTQITTTELSDLRVTVQRYYQSSLEIESFGYNVAFTFSSNGTQFDAKSQSLEVRERFNDSGDFFLRLLPFSFGSGENVPPNLRGISLNRLGTATGNILNQVAGTYTITVSVAVDGNNGNLDLGGRRSGENLQGAAVTITSINRRGNESTTGTTDLTALEGRVSQNETDIATLQTANTANDQELATLRTRLTTLEASGATQAEITAVTNRITALENSSTANESRIQALEAQNTSTQAQIDQLTATAVTNTQLTPVLANIQGNTDAITALETRVNQNETDIATLQTANTANDQELVTLRTRLTTLEANGATQAEITAVTNRITALESSSTANESRIQALEAQNRGTQTQIDQLTTNVSTLLSSVNETENLRTELNTLKREVRRESSKSDDQDYILGGLVIGGVLLNDLVLNEYGDYVWGHNNTYLYEGTEKELIEAKPSQTGLRLSGHTPSTQ